MADEDPELVLDLRFREKYVVSFGYEDQLLVRGIEHPEFPFPYQMLLFPYNANYLDYFRVFLSYHGRTPETFKPENFEDKHIQILTEAGVFEELDIDALTRLLVEGDLRVLDPNVRDLLGSDNADEVVLANARGGMLGGVMFLEDENTMILLIESCVAPASLDPDATMGHYEIGTLPDYFLERVNKVFLNNRIFTFRRQ